MSKHNYTNPAFSQSSEFYPVLQTHPKNDSAQRFGYNRTLKSNYNGQRVGNNADRSVRIHRSMSTRSMTPKIGNNHAAAAAPFTIQRQSREYSSLRSSYQPSHTKSSFSMNFNGALETGSSGRYALVPVEELAAENGQYYALVPGSKSEDIYNCKRYAKSQDNLDYSESNVHEQEQLHSFCEDACTSLPSNFEQTVSVPKKRRITLQNRQSSAQNLNATKIKHAFSSDFGSKSFLLVDKNSNQRYQMVPTAEDEELVDDNHEVIQMLNGKAHRYAVIPTDDDDDHLDENDEEEEETCLSNTDLEKHTPSQSTAPYTSTPQKVASMCNLTTQPNTPLKNPAATKMLYDLLSTPPHKNITRNALVSQKSVSQASMITQKDHLRRQCNEGNQTLNTNDESSPQRLPRRNTQISQQRLQYEAVAPVSVSASVHSSPTSIAVDRTMAVIQPRLATKTIDEEEEICEEEPAKGFSNISYSQRLANAAITLAIVSLMLVLGSSVNLGLIIYMIAYFGKSFYLQFSLIASFSGVGLGFLGFRSRHCDSLPNRSYISGYVLVTIFCLLKSCCLLVILVLEPYPGLPMHDVTTGVILGLSTFTMFFIGLGVVGSVWCYRPPPDNRVNVA